MDILLINPYSQEIFGINEATVEVHVGLLNLAAFLENKGKKVGFLDANAMQMPQHEVIEIVRKTNPKVVGITVNIFSFLQAIRYTENIKNIANDITVVWGGPHPTIASDLCFKKSKVDFIVIGEGELTLYESLEQVLSKKGLEDVKGIVYRQEDGNIKMNSPRERIKNLDGLPMPAYHLLPDLKYYRAFVRKGPHMGIITSRGCPYQCIFCSNAVFKNAITMRSPENILEEIDFLVNRYHIRQIDILDDNFTMDKRRIDKFCDLLLSRNYKICINLQSGIRADRIDDILMKKLRKAGVFKVGFGVETGNKTVLAGVKKRLDLDKVLEASRLARKHGMFVVGFFMIGLPGDNEQTLNETIDFAIKMNPHIANFTMTIPFYGTELYKKIEQDGRFIVDTKDGISSGFYAAKSYFELGNLTPELMIKFYKLAYQKFYFRFTKIMDIVCSMRSIGEFKWFFENSFNTLFPKNK